MCVALGELKEGVNVQTGDMVTCQCGAAFRWSFCCPQKTTSLSRTRSHMSKVEAQVANSSSNNNNNNNNDDNAAAAAPRPGHGVWICEFCGHQNQLALEPEEVRALLSLRSLCLMCCFCVLF